MTVQILARILCLPPVRAALIWYAKRTPYFHLDGYMNRYWLVPYADPEAGPGCGLIPWRHNPIKRWFQEKGLAIRIHHILREDWAPHYHNHPWSARTFILKGWYFERRGLPREQHKGRWERWYAEKCRNAGDTFRIEHTDLHKITHVRIGGVWTLFVTEEKQQSWGFEVDGQIVPWREYEGRN